MRLINTNQRGGTVVVAVCVSLVAMLGVIALSLDGGMLLDNRRKTQAAADAAALAAGSELYRTLFSNGGLDNGPLPGKTGPAAGKIRDFAKEVAKANGFEDGENGVTVEVYIPPISGPFTGQTGHVEVKISMAQRRYFSKVFGAAENIPIGAPRWHAANAQPSITGSSSSIRWRRARSRPPEEAAWMWAVPRACS